MNEKVKVTKVADLPVGCKIVEKPANVELLARGKGKWIAICENIMAAPNTQTVGIELGSLVNQPNAKSRIQSIRTSIKETWKDLKYKGEIKFYLKDSVLMAWTNK